MRRYIYYLTAILLLLAACKGEEDIRERARKELTKTATRYAHNAQDLIISNVNEIFHCEQGCIFNFTGSSIGDDGNPVSQRMEFVYYNDGKNKVTNLLYPRSQRTTVVGNALMGAGSGVPFLPIFRRAGFYKGWQHVDDDPMRKSI